LIEKLHVDELVVERCRVAAGSIADQVEFWTRGDTTVSVERTVARLLGVDGVDAHDVPLPNVLVDQLVRAGKTGDGLFYWMGNAALATGLSPQEIALTAARDELDITSFEPRGSSQGTHALEQAVDAGIARIDRTRISRDSRFGATPRGPQPWLYLIVATGNIYEDVVQARSAACQGADIIAVIRSTAQSLLDYMPYGPTIEGFGGT